MHCKYLPLSPYKALEKFSKALYGTKGGTYSARIFRPVMYMTVSLLPLQIIYHSTHPCCLYPYFLKVTVLMLSALESVLTWQIEKITFFFLIG